jgi:hypothetical protein
MRGRCARERALTGRLTQTRGVAISTGGIIEEWGAPKLATVLPDTTRLVRELRPTRSKSYPAEELAVEIEQLRNALLKRS